MIKLRLGLNNVAAGTVCCSPTDHVLTERMIKRNEGEDVTWSMGRRPSFFQSIPGAVEELQDNSIFFLPRTGSRPPPAPPSPPHSAPPPTHLRAHFGMTPAVHLSYWP